MSDTIVEKKGFGTRMKNSFSGILGGIIFILIGIGILVWNERSNVINIHDVKELREVYTDVASNKVDKAYEGKLIVTPGKLDFGNETLTDSTFNINIETPILVRKVEMYQWNEDKEDSESETKYTYSKEWKEEVIDSSAFKEPGSHTNPSSMPYSRETAYAKDLKVGEYKLSSAYTTLLEAEARYTDFAEATIPEGYKEHEGYIMKSEDPANPQVGDVRISFYYGDYNDVTVMGKLQGDTIIEYTTKEKTRITQLVKGTHDGDYIITNMEKANKAFKWIFRLIGTLLIIGGIRSIFGPLSTLASYVPILGSLANGAIGIISFLVGLAISLIVIAISWLVFRPILGICLLVGAIVLIILAKTLTSKKKEAPVIPQPAQPVQPAEPAPEPEEKTEE